MFDRRDRGGEVDLQLAAEQIGQGGRIAAIGDVKHVDAGHHLEQLTADVRRGPGAGRSEIDRGGIGFGIGDELGNCLGRKRRIDDHDEGDWITLATGGNVMDEIETELVIERRVDCCCRDDGE